MPVYVDPAMNYGGSATFKWKTSCHMWADTEEELLLLAAKIGLKPNWIQRPKTKPGAERPFVHFDLTESKRDIAVAKGAISLTWDEVRILWSRMGFIGKKWDIPEGAKQPPRLNPSHLPPAARPAEEPASGGEPPPASPLSAFLDLKCGGCKRTFGSSVQIDRPAKVTCYHCGWTMPREGLAALVSLLQVLREAPMQAEAPAAPPKPKKTPISAPTAQKIPASGPVRVKTVRRPL
jgi:hypothetical protein